MSSSLQPSWEKQNRDSLKLQQRKFRLDTRKEEREALFLTD